MMKSIILCEGSTDYALLQYYMRTVNGWNDCDNQSKMFKIEKQKSRRLEKKSDFLTIAATGGCSNLVSEGLKQVLDINKNSKPDGSELFEKIVIATDNDEVDTASNFEKQTAILFQSYNVDVSTPLKCNDWISCKTSYLVDSSKEFSFQILLLVIPFDEQGAMETFLLNSISLKEPEEKLVIDDCISFVDNIFSKIKSDSVLAKKYETGRRYVTKAKYDVYFSIRTPATQFMQRQNILKNISWQNYTNIQDTFSKLQNL